MNRVWNRARQVVWLAWLAGALLALALVLAVAGATDTALVLAVCSIGASLLARQT